MASPIQSVQRAAAVLSVLGSAGRELALHEIAAALDLPKPTAHGIVRTLVDVGFVHQDLDGGAYTLGVAIHELGQGGLDPHDLRSHASGWADRLASRTTLEVLVCVPAPTGARVVHHVFRPDDSVQVLRIDEVLPLHATAIGKALLAASHGVAGRLRTLPLEAYTRRTVTTRPRLEAEVDTVRERGYAVEYGEHVPELAGAAMPLRGVGGIVVGAIGVQGPRERVLANDGARGDVVAELHDTAFAVTRAIGTPP